LLTIVTAIGGRWLGDCWWEQLRTFDSFAEKGRALDYSGDVLFILYQSLLALFESRLQLEKLARAQRLHLATHRLR